MLAARFVVGWCGFASAAVAASDDGASSAVATLERAGVVSCQPTFPVFCSNIHVSCAGSSAIQAFAFKLRARGASASIETTADTSGIAPLYENGRAEWNAHDGTVIVWPREGPGYIKLAADGRYSFRHYTAQAATMSQGHCR